MIRNIRVHRSHDAEIVDARADIGKNLADIDTALAELAECEWRGKCGTGTSLRLQRDWYRLAAEFGERRLWIEGIHVRRTAVHEQMQNTLGFGRQRRRSGGKRIYSIGTLCRLQTTGALQG